MKYFYVLAIFLVLEAFQTTHTAPAVDNEIKEQYRLPTNIFPSQYILTFTPYINKAGKDGKERFSFDGIADISFSPTEDKLKKIVLHKKDIQILTKTLKKDTTPIEIVNEDHNNITDLYTLTLKDELIKGGKYILSFTFKGQMKDDMKGFYKSSYKDQKGKDIWIGSTQFQTHYARRAFPCFDEPQFKAKFTIKINHEEEFKRIYSNMDKEGDSMRAGDGRLITTFKETPVMSTYLVAFLISNFDGHVKDEFSVIARPEYKSQAKYSFDEGQEILKALSKYTDHDYYELGVPKMHMAAIPDFSAGAMENWGLLTYRERALLYDSDETTDTDQQKIALTVAHEQAHMWFGDYVTCSWWSHTWLNEGFARYFQYFIPHDLYKDWDLDKQFTVAQIHTVFTTDSSSDTHALSEKNINSQPEIRTMFDSISYNKGASIIRMFRYAMGEANFRKALHNYLEDRKLSVSEPEHLFDAFEAVWKPKGVTTRNFFTEWTEQVGYPVVSVKVVDDGKAFEVTQERYLTEEDAGEKSLTYTIPFTYTTQKKPNFESPKPENVKFIKEKTKIDLGESEQLGKSDYIIANIEQMGYFRVMYDPDMLHNIHHALESKNFGEIGEVNRAHFINDLFNFGVSAHLPYDVIFDILSYLSLETSYMPWNAAFAGFKFIENKLGEDEELKNRLQKLLEKVYDHVKFEQSKDEKRLDTYNRAQVLYWACKYDFKDCREKTENLFNQLKEDESKTINKNIRSVVYCSAIRNAKNLDNYKFLTARYEKSVVSTEQTLILNSLGCVRDTNHIEEYYKYILSDKIRKQDRVGSLNSLVTENPKTPEILFKLIAKDHVALGKALEAGDDDVAKIVSNIATYFKTEDQKKSLEEFANKKDLKESAKESLQKAIKKIEKNIKWMNSYQKDLIKALKGGVAKLAFSTVLITFATLLCYLSIY